MQGAAERSHAQLFVLVAVAVVTLVGAAHVYTRAFPSSELVMRARGVEVDRAGAGRVIGSERHFLNPLVLLPGCPLRTLTGIACPGCGTTRAVVSLAEGDAWRAAGWNPLATLLILGSVLFGGVALLSPALAGRLSALTARVITSPAGRGLCIAAALAQATFLTLRGV